MEESVFAPYPNRLITNIGGCFSPDTLVYGSVGNVIIIKHSTDGASLQVIDDAHNWVNGLAVAPNNAPEHLARTFVTCGHDGYVRLWNVDTLSIVKGHRTHFSRKGTEKVSVLAMDWSSANPNLVMSIGKDGCLVLWHLTENITYKHQFGDTLSFPLTLACSPAQENIVAVGMGGVVCVIRIEQRRVRVIARLRVFSHPILDLAWQPTLDNPILAATSKSAQLSLWDIQNEKCIKTWRLDNYQMKASNDLTPGSVYPLLWLNPATLLARSGPSLIAIDCATVEAIHANGGKPWKILETPHNRDFQVLVKSCADGDRVWTFGSDRKIVEIALGEGGGQRRSIGLMNGGNVCMAVCPHDPQLLVFAGSDATVRFWNVTKPTGTVVSQPKGVLDKVMSLCWHHSKENTVLFGTQTGRIGVMEGGRPPRLLQPCSSRPVYWMCWGPPPPCLSASVTQVLYVVTAKKLFVYKDISSDDKAVNLSNVMTLPASGVTDASWKPDMSLLAVGGKQGEICIYEASNIEQAPPLTLNFVDSLQYIAWHPEMTTSDSEPSVCRDWITCGSCDSSGVVKVYAVTRTAEERLAAEVKATLRGHTESVQSVAWSPHVTGRLVTGSADGTARIWNVLDETVLFIYDHLIDWRNWLTIWNPVNPDYMISSTRIGTAVTWRISNKTSKDPAELETKIKPKKSKYSKKKTHACEVATEEEYKAGKSGGLKGKEKKNEKDKVQAQVVSCSKIQMASKLDKGWAKSKHGTEFGTCHRLLSAPNTERPQIYSLSFFGPSEILEAKMPELIEEMDEKEMEFAMTWQGRLKEYVEKQIAEGRVTTRVLALAASVSPRMWHAACLALAQKCRIANSHANAACYLVAAGRCHQAIEVLMEGKMFTEALCLARSQLPDDDPAVVDISKAYAQELIADGHTSRAVECLIFAEDYLLAAECLSKSGDRVGVSAAALAARLADNPEKEHQYALSAFALNLLHSNPNDYDCNLVQLQIPSVQLLQTVVDSLQAPESPSNKPLLESLKEVVPSEKLSECYQELMAMTEVNTAPKIDQNLVQELVKVHQLGLAASAAGERARCQHTLRALQAAHLQSSAQLCLLAQKLSPDLQLNSLFNNQSALGTSLRAFLCLALLHKAGINEEESVALLPRIAALKEDLLHEKAFSYHRAKCELPLREKQLSNLSTTVQQVRPSNPIRVDSSQHVDALASDMAHLSCNNSRDESIQSSLNSTNSDSINGEEGGEVVGNSEDGKKPECHKVLNGSDAGEVLVTKLVAERNQLVITISKVEAERTVIPNPVIGLSLLRNYFMEHSQASETAKENLDLIVEKYLPLIMK